MNKKGFTLVELLVVIAIIGLLSTIAIVSLSGARAKARDAKRVGDLRTVQTALEAYASDQGSYPTLPSSFSNLNAGTYLPTIPSDPVVSNSYTYCVATSTNSAYYLLASTNIEGTKPAGTVSMVFSTLNKCVGLTSKTSLDCNATTNFCITNVPSSSAATAFN